MSDNPAMTGQTSGPVTRPAYCYAIRHASGGEALFLTSWPDPVLVADMPAIWNAASPQTFTPAAIGHGPVERADGLDKATFEIRGRLGEVGEMSRYVLQGAVPKIQTEVFKVALGAVQAGEAAIWGRDTLTVQSGLVSTFALEGHQMIAQCGPEPLLSSHQVPRWRYTRTCNRQLYAPDCGVNRADFMFNGQILALDAPNRTLLIYGQHPDADANFFRQGVAVHDATGLRLSIYATAHQGSDTLITLHSWSPDLALTDTVTIYAGCRHTFDDCTNKFSNAANFGGCPYIPNKNPTLHGV
jgi:hypothetical protein